MISRRVLEVSTAALTGSFGLAVAVSSVDNGIGWSTAGVDSGTFPFLAGVIIVLGSLYNLGRGALAGTAVVVSRADLRRVAALFVPAAIFIGVIPAIGIYLASAGYMFAVLALPKHQSPLRSLVIAAITPVVLYVVFERLFLVTLPHGALAAALGF
jgi:Tripartite tricarboxylate transporter TctB family